MAAGGLLCPSVDTLTKIESLAKLYQMGYLSNTVDAPMEKLVAMEQAGLEAEAEAWQCICVPSSNDISCLQRNVIAGLRQGSSGMRPTCLNGARSIRCGCLCGAAWSMWFEE